jgi:D-alanyl-D-alanine carboxypeptidase
VTSEEKEKFQVDMKLQTPKREWEEMRGIPTVVGKATITFDNKLIKELPIYYAIADTEQPSLFERFKSLFTAMIGVNHNG